MGNDGVGIKFWKNVGHPHDVILDFDHEEQIFVIWTDAEAMCEIIALPKRLRRLPMLRTSTAAPHHEDFNSGLPRSGRQAAEPFATAT
jgi:hypothetical protein